MASQPFVVIGLAPESAVDGTPLDGTIYCNAKVKNAGLPAAGQYQAISASGAGQYLTLRPPDESSPSSSCY